MKIKTNKKGLMPRTIILGIIAIAVIVSYIAFMPHLSRIFAFFKSSFDDLSLSDQSEMKANFNQLIENIKACRDMDDSECLCYGLPDFPSTFRKECQLEIEQKDKSTTITLLFNTKKALNASIEQVQISAACFSKGWSESLYFKALGEKKIIDFKLLKITEEKKVEKEWIPEEKRHREYIYEKKWCPFFQPKSRLTANKMPILSSQFYKLSGSTLGFTVLPDAGFVSKTADKIRKQTEAREKLPKCLPKRLDAIEEFDKIVNALKKGEDSELAIELPQNYRIWIFGEGNMLLQYKKGEESELAERYNEIAKKKSVHEVFTFDINCKESTEDEFLLDGDKIKIKKTAEGSCIEKV